MTLQAKRHDTSVAAPRNALALVHQIVRSPGRPLDGPDRAFFEPRFGHNFSEVRVHADTQASAAAHEVTAQAFTVGEHIVFSQGQFAPNSTAGRHLLAHELTHVVQQRAGGPALQRRAANCPDAPPSPPTIKTMDDFIALVARVETDNPSIKNDPIRIARLISRTKYEGSAWDWMLPSTKGEPGVALDQRIEPGSKHPYGHLSLGPRARSVRHIGKVTMDDIGSLCFKLTVSLPGGGVEDPMHIIAGIVADAEALPAGTGATGLSKVVQPLPASVSQRGASTWVGDVGQAAGEWMAVVPLPDKEGATKDDYMLKEAPAQDLMADVDGVAMTSKSAASGFALDRTKPLSDNLQRFFSPAQRTGRARRFHIFCSAEGFALEPDGVTLTNSAKKAIGQQVKDFADWYTRNNPHVLLYLASVSRSWHVSKALVDRAGDWQWFADKFVRFVQENLATEGP
ncbi:MAG: DUF4157 domain-containing protein [Chloroflexi bacterium]|nr:DUF4157 domain-containing protein [Chloroflexota bacterium]